MRYLVLLSLSLLTATNLFSMLRLQKVVRSYNAIMLLQKRNMSYFKDLKQIVGDDETKKAFEALSDEFLAKPTYGSVLAKSVYAALSVHQQEAVRTILNTAITPLYDDGDLRVTGFGTRGTGITKLMYDIEFKSYEAVIRYSIKVKLNRPMLLDLLKVYDGKEEVATKIREFPEKIIQHGKDLDSFFIELEEKKKKKSWFSS